MKDSLGDRIKDFYESRSKTSLVRRIPVIIRVDGRCFSKFCKRFKKLYDSNLHEVLNSVMEYMCLKIQGAKFAERHSDEISILVTDYDKLTTDAFFGYEVQKICSVTSAMATSVFIKELISKTLFSGFDYLTYEDEFPQFDSRCFNIPKNEIVNYFYWRLLDAKRNSINMNAMSHFSHKELQGKSSDEMKKMMIQEKGFSWENLPQEKKTGFMCVKRETVGIIPDGPKKGEEYIRNNWSIEPSPKDLECLRKEIDNSLNSNS